MEGLHKLRALAFLVLTAVIVQTHGLGAKPHEQETLGMEAPRKLKVLAFHGSGQNTALYEAAVSKWDPAILDLLDITYLQGWYPAGYPDNVKPSSGLYDWFTFNEDLTAAYFYEESVAQTLDFMEKNGPFDGLMGHSQGGVFAGFIAALQDKGKSCLGKSAADLPPFRFFICSFGGSLPGTEVYMGPPMNIPTLHFIGLEDPLRPSEEANAKLYKNPVIIRLPQPHGFPKFSKEDFQTLLKFVKGVQSNPIEQAEEAYALSASSL